MGTWLPPSSQDYDYEYAEKSPACIVNEVAGTVIGYFSIVADSDLYEEIRRWAEEGSAERLKEALERDNVPVLRLNHQHNGVEELDGRERKARPRDGFVGRGAPARGWFASEDRVSDGREEKCDECGPQRLTGKVVLVRLRGELALARRVVGQFGLELGDGQLVSRRLELRALGGASIPRVYARGLGLRDRGDRPGSCAQSGGATVAGRAPCATRRWVAQRSHHREHVARVPRGDAKARYMRRCRPLMVRSRRAM